MRRFLCCGLDNDGSPAHIIDFHSVTDSSRRLLVFVNPKSGSGRASRIFRQRILPALHTNAINFELVETEAAGHAARVVAGRADLGSFNAIVIVSGDGLIFEVLNALLARKDAAHLLGRVPFAIVPCGSGNGLLSSVFAYRGQPIDNARFLEGAVETLAHADAVSLPVNLVRIETPERHAFGSFLSVGWGLMSDIDIESESLRALCGGNRFFWGALWRVAMLRSYKARLSFLEAPPDREMPDIDETPVYGQTTNTIDVEYGQGSRDDDDPWTGKVDADVPALDAPLPAQWRTIEDEFLVVYAVSLSHISNINVYAPEARIREPQIHLTYALRRDVKSKAEVAKFLTAIESRKHLDIPFCRYVKVRAFRLEPHEEDCRRSPIVVDGEAIPETKKIQATVSDLCMRVVSK